MTTVGFIGLGWMGDPMSRNLLQAGHQVMVYDLRPEAMEKAVSLGATAAASAADLAVCDPIFVIVQTGAQVADVVGRLASRLPEGQRCTVVVMSTVTPRLVLDLSKDFGPQGFDFVDAPVSGAPILAQLAALSIMVGGEPDHVQRIEPLLQVMGKNIVHLGPLGSGLAMKLVNNLVSLANAYILPEALKIGLTYGLDLSAMIQVIKASSGSNWLVENWPMYVGLLNLVANDPPQRENFNHIARKDLQAAVSLVEDLGLDSPIARAVLSIVEKGDVITPELFAKMSTAAEQ